MYFRESLQFIFNLHPPEPPATTGRTAGPNAASPPRNNSPPPVCRRPGQPYRPPAPTLNPKIDSGVPLRRAPLPAAAGSSFTPTSPP